MLPYAINGSEKAGSFSQAAKLQAADYTTLWQFISLSLSESGPYLYVLSEWVMGVFCL